MMMVASGDIESVLSLSTISQGDKLMKCKISPDIEGNVYCTFCGMCFSSQKDMAIHKLEKHDMTGFCSVCSKNFQSLHGYKSHRKIHENELGLLGGEALPQCPLCGKVCQRQDHLDSHMKSHSNTKHFACAHCGNTYKHKHHLQRHLNHCSFKQKNRESSMEFAPH